MQRGRKPRRDFYLAFQVFCVVALTEMVAASLLGPSPRYHSLSVVEAALLIAAATYLLSKKFDDPF